MTTGQFARQWKKLKQIASLRVEMQFFMEMTDELVYHLAMLHSEDGIGAASQP
ncbi:MAG TPA: hypothetical protein V6C57_14590 [Coleofasciculaceae cyanobacterium]